MVQSASDPVVCITGGARRLGHAIAQDLAQVGFRVAITYRHSAEEAQQTITDLRARGVDAAAFPLDLAHAEAIPPAAQAILERFGRLDALVNNAGIHSPAALDSVSPSQWDEAFALHARAPMLLTQALLPELRQRKGRVVHLGSLGAAAAWPQYAHYCASKAALESLTRTMARAFAPDVSVNCVAPGWIQMKDSPLGQQEDPAVAERFAARTPMQRNGHAAEVAAAVRFFLTGPHFITGQVLAVDGGLGLV